MNLEYQGNKVVIFIFRFQDFSWSDHRLKFEIAEKNSKIAEQNANCHAEVLVQLQYLFTYQLRPIWMARGRNQNGDIMQMADINSHNNTHITIP